MTSTDLQLQNFVTDEALSKREEYERCAPNAYEQSDMQVLAAIREIRALRERIRVLEAALRPIYETWGSRGRDALTYVQFINAEKAIAAPVVQS